MSSVSSYVLYMKTTCQPLTDEKNDTACGHIDNVSDTEIIDAIAALWGADGFDAEDDDNLSALAERLGVTEDDAETPDVVGTMSDRLDRVTDRLLVGEGCYGLRITWSEWGRRLEGKTSAEISQMLEGA
jgi:hypothetical protein